MQLYVVKTHLATAGQAEGDTVLYDWDAYIGNGRHTSGVSDSEEDATAQVEGVLKTASSGLAAWGEIVPVRVDLDCLPSFERMADGRRTAIRWPDGRIIWSQVPATSAAV